LWRAQLCFLVVANEKNLRTTFLLLSVLSLFVKAKVAEYPRDQAVVFIPVKTDGSSPPSSFA